MIYFTTQTTSIKFPPSPGGLYIDHKSTSSTVSRRPATDQIADHTPEIEIPPILPNPKERELAKLEKLSLLQHKKSASVKMNYLTALLVITFSVLGAYGAPTSCPEPFGVQAYAHPEYCDQFFLCTNGTLTLETCENGLTFDGKGHVYNHCNYNWAVDCGHRKYDPTPLSSPGCEYRFGIYPDSDKCSTTYLKCAHGEPHVSPCDDGLVYDDRIHGCNWPDQLLEICDPTAVVGFVCPAHVPSHSPAARFWPFPRFPVQGDCHRLITCVDGHPRLITCGEGKIFDKNTLTCEEDIPCVA